MPRPLTSIVVPELFGKLKLLDLKLHISRKEVELVLGVSKATLSAYINGTDNKKKDRMPPERLEQLLTLLQAKNPKLTREMARAAWLNPNLTEFEQALLPPPVASFVGILQTVRQQLVITPIRILHDPMRSRVNQLSMLADDDITLPSEPAGQIVLQSNQSLRFEIATQPGKMLYAACETGIGWHQVLPGRRHPGRAIAPIERVPQASVPAISFKPPFGPHRFVFIEADLPNILGRQAPETLTTPLTLADITALDQALQHQAQNWRWGEITVIVQAANT